MGRDLPLWSVAPFGAMLLAVAVMPFVAPAHWRSNRNKAIVSALLGVPVAVWVGTRDPAAVAHAAREYVGFIVLLATLFVVSGGIVVRGALAGTPAVNTAMLALGAVLASLAGTTGASMLLARPLLRANAARTEKTHLFVFFIFVVANSGGLLTPLGDPPLYLGYLRGVPFLWTLRLVALWLVADPLGARLLAAISAGSVLMGAYSYIGNGPNFMVRAMAEEAGVTMPGFFRYMLWAAAVLGPLHLALTFLFFA